MMRTQPSQEPSVASRELGLSTHGDPHDLQTTAEPSGWLHQIYGVFAGFLGEANTATDRPADKPTLTRKGVSNDDPILPKSYNIANCNSENPHNSNTTIQSQLIPQNLATIESDRQSVWSEESDSTNKYQMAVVIEDLDGNRKELLALFDTQSPSNFISRRTFDKIGKVKGRPIPRGKVRSYQSPIDGSITTPQYFAYVTMWNKRIGLFDRAAKLKIMEGTDGFQVILGRPFINKHSKNISLLGRIEEANQVPDLAASTNLVAALRRIRKSKQQEAIDSARDKEQRERDRQAAMELHKKWDSSSPVPSGSSIRTGSTNNSTWSEMSQTLPVSCSSSCQSYSAMTLSTPDSDGRTIAIQQEDILPIDGSTQLPDYAAEWRSQRTDTSSTQFTKYSFGKSTISSTSSWGSATHIVEDTGPISGSKPE